MNAPEREPAGRSASLRAAINAGTLVGTLAGLFDGLVRTVGIDPGLFLIRFKEQGAWTALTFGWPELAEVPGLLGCTLAAGFLYAIFGGFLAAVLGVLAHRWLGAGFQERYRRLLWACLSAWFFLELYWWTRSEIYSGLSATHPKRLVAAVGLLAVSALLGRVALALRGRLPRAVRLASPFVVLGVALMGGLYYVSDRGVTAQRGHPNSRTRSRPNVLIFVVDALRQDVLGCYGHPTVKTPTMDRLAQEGVRFSNAFVQAPFTWSSFGSILTGKYPRRHGLVKMAPGYSLPPNVTLPYYLQGARLVEGGGQLSEEDYLGAAFLTGTLSHGSGLARGFDYYFEALVGHELVDVHSRWSAFRSGLLPWLYKNKLGQRVDNQLVATTAVDWLRRNGDLRWVAMVHYYSTHTPYNPPDEFRQMYCDPGYDGPLQFFDSLYHRIPIERGDYQLSEADVRQIRDLYWAGVTQADAMIQTVLEQLEESGVLENTIVVVTSDHGESLGEHGLWEHNNMYQDNLRVPLIMRWPVGLPGGTVVDAAVDSIDLVPTLVELLQLESLPASAALTPEASHDDAVQAVDGVSLLALVRGEVDQVRPYSFAENGRFASVQDDRWKLIVRQEQLTAEGWRAMRQAGPQARPVPGLEPPRLFDLRADSLELKDLYDASDAQVMERVDALALVLLDWSASMPLRGDLVQRSHRDIQAEADRMRALGYGGGIGEGED